jgi:HEAT repeat protein
MTAACPRTVRRRSTWTAAIMVFLCTGAVPGARQDDPVQAGRAALKQGDVRKAVALADRVLERDPRHRDALALKIEALATARDWESALPPYERYLAAGGSEDAELLRNIGRALLWEAAAFYPSLRPGALGRLACGGDRQALAELKRYSGSGRPEDVEPLVYKARLGDFEAVLALREFATSAPPGMRALGLQALARLGDRGATRAIRAALTHEDASLRLAGARTARVLTPLAVKEQLVTLADDPNPLIQAEARAALAALGQSEWANQLRSLLDNPVPDLRLAGLAGLVALQGSQAALVDGLARVADMRNSMAWTEAIELLFAHAPDRAAAAVESALADPNANSRILALRLYPRMPEPNREALARLRELLKDPNTFVRVEAAAALAGRPSLCES